MLTCCKCLSLWLLLTLKDFSQTKHSAIQHSTPNVVAIVCYCMLVCCVLYCMLCLCYCVCVLGLEDQEQPRCTHWLQAQCSTSSRPIRCEVCISCDIWALIQASEMWDYNTHKNSWVIKAQMRLISTAGSWHPVRAVPSIKILIISLPT